MLETTPAAGTDGRLAASLGEFVRRVGATPPGICPLAVQLSLLQAGAAQTCGKCVPCRDGLPQLARMLERVVDCAADADEGTLAAMRALAETIRDTSDCAIGYEAARSFLAGLDAYRRRVRQPRGAAPCVSGRRRPAAALRGAVPGARERARLHRAGGRGATTPAPCAMIRKDNPFPTACALICEHPCEARCRRAHGRRRPSTSAASSATPWTTRRPTGPHAQARLAATGRRVAVVGGGPSGLTCAYFLALMGHSRHGVRGAQASSGGMMRYGIPAYRFPRERLDEDIRAILGAGGIEVRAREPRSARRRDGATSPRDLRRRVRGGRGPRRQGAALAARRRAGRHRRRWRCSRAIGDGATPDFAGKRVVVVGGGNVAMDCARTSVRAGAARGGRGVPPPPRGHDRPGRARLRPPWRRAWSCSPSWRRSPWRWTGTGRCAGLAMQPQMTGPMPRRAPISGRRREAAAVRAGRRGARSRGAGHRVRPVRGVRHAGQPRPARAPTPACAPPASPTSLWAATARPAPPRSSRPSAPARWRRATSTSCSATTTSSPATWRCRPHAPTTAPPWARVNLSERPPRARKRDFACVEERHDPRRGRSGVRPLPALRPLRLRRARGRKDPVCVTARHRPVPSPPCRWPPRRRPAHPQRPAPARPAGSPSTASPSRCAPGPPSSPPRARRASTSPRCASSKGVAR